MVGGPRGRVVLLRRQGQHPVPHRDLAGDAPRLWRAQPAHRRPGQPVRHLRREKASQAAGWAARSVGTPNGSQPDALRYAIASVLPEQNDTDLSDEEIIRRINDELVATWGNLVNRVLTLSDSQLRRARCPSPDALTSDRRGARRHRRRGIGTAVGHIEAVELRAGLRTAMEAASEVNAYLNCERALEGGQGRPATGGDDPMDRHPGDQRASGWPSPRTCRSRHSHGSVRCSGWPAEVKGWERPEVDGGTGLGTVETLFTKLEADALDD